ncbi:hypothetical protein D3C73_875030 [compost metagenome]
MGNPQTGERAAHQRLGIIGAHADACRAMQMQLSISLEAPGEWRGQAIPVEPVVFDQLRRVSRHATTFQVVGAGARNTHHARQWCGDKAGIGHLSGTQHQIDLAQVQPLHVDKAVDQVQLYVEAGVEHQKIGNHRRQVSTPECGGGIDADQAFRRAAQGHSFGAGQLQLRHNPPRPFSKGKASGCGAHGMGAANEQLAANSGFQAVDAPCHRRRRQRMTARGRREAASFKDIEKKPELSGQLRGVHVSVLLVRIWHSHCALLCVSPPSLTA